MYQGNTIYRSQGKTVLGVMLHIAAMLVTYNTIDIQIEYIKN